MSFALCLNSLCLAVCLFGVCRVELVTMTCFVVVWTVGFVVVSVSLSLLLRCDVVVLIQSWPWQ